jgi:CRP-like cAMP-binding protein
MLALTEEEWSAHERALIPATIKKGEYFLKAGEVCNYVGFVNVGCFRYFNILNGEDFTTQIAFEGEYITNYKSFLTRTPAIDHIIALEDSEILQLDYNAMQQLYQHYPVWQKFGRLIAESIFIESTNRWQSLLLQSAEERYIALLKNQPHILNRVPLKFIASYLGVAPESLSRIRKRISQPKI